MLKGILAGLVVGAIATACVLKAVAAHRAERASATSGAGNTTGAPGPEALKASVEALRSANVQLKRTIEPRKEELASLEIAVLAGGKKKKRKAGELTWKELAPALAKAFGPGNEGEERESKEFQAARIDMLALVARLSKELGIPLNEVMSSPGGMPQLLRAMLETGTPPASPGQLASVDTLIDAYAKNWNKLREGDSTSGLERRLGMSELADGYVQGVLDTMTAEQKENSREFVDMVSGMTEEMGANSNYSSGSREAVAQQLSDSWAKSLQLEDSQKALLGPVVARYMKDFEDAANKQNGGVPAEGRLAWKSIENERMRAMIRAQQEIASIASLSPAQAKALKDWATLYNFRIQGDEEEAVPVPEGQDR